MTRRFLLPILSLVIAGCASVGAGTRRGVDARSQLTALRHTVDSLADSPDFRNAHWGILVVDPERGDTLYSRNAGKLFLPASNMKIVTSAVALEQLGPDFGYRTAFAARGPVRDGVLAGNLAVVGRGDPTISDHMWVDAMLPLRGVADSLAARGIRRIAGRLTAAGNAFPGPALGFGWSWSDLDDSYSAGVDELLFNEGFSVIHVRAGRWPGDSSIVETRPARSFPLVRASVATVAAPACSVASDSAPPCPSPQTASLPVAPRRRAELQIRKDTLRGDVIVSGTILAGDSATLEITHTDPNLAYLAALTEALRERGIVVDSTPTASVDTVTSAADTLLVTASRPLREILPALMKPSQNQIAEALLRTLGLERAAVGTADSGRRVVERQLDAWGAPTGSYVIRDGSGLSRYDYLSPDVIVRVLEAMRRSPHAQLYYDAMPIAGVDGTIRTRMRGTAAENNVHAKTGSVANARSLSGYVCTAGGRTLLFSMLSNNWTVPAATVTRAMDVIAAQLASLDLR